MSDTPPASRRPADGATRPDPRWAAVAAIERAEGNGVGDPLGPGPQDDFPPRWR
jgi:hypothetical protein